MIVSKCAICGGKVEERYYPPGVVDRLRNSERGIMDQKKLKKLDVIGSTYVAKR
jgi:hypothetical protein